jgi:hypothetical protein
MEKLFINNNFHYVEVIPIGNGDSWSLHNICAEITSKYSVRDANPDLVIVWIDRERQFCGSDGVAMAIHAALTAVGVPDEKLAVCVPDRMTENVILADESMIAIEFELSEYKYALEGKNGKAALRRLLGQRSEAYKETVTGVRLLKKVRLRRCANCSPSVKAFTDRLAIPCWWLE